LSGIAVEKLQLPAEKTVAGLTEYWKASQEKKEEQLETIFAEHLEKEKASLVAALYEHAMNNPESDATYALSNPSLATELMSWLNDAGFRTAVSSPGAVFVAAPDRPRLKKLLTFRV
jgi:hypothetical protein